MKWNRKFYVGAIALFCAVTVASGAAAFGRSRVAEVFAAASGRPELKVTLAGMVMRDNTEVMLDKAGTVNPGETLRWVIASQNDGDGAAREYKAVGQIPAGTLLIAGSTVADGEASVTFSIDSGQTYSAQPLVEEKQADGSVKRVPAPISMYTQVRYEWSDALAAGGTLNASYKVRVK